MVLPVDYVDLALRVTRDEFVRDCPFYFLVGKQALDHPRKRHRTDVFDLVDPSQDTTGATRTVDPEALTSDAETLVLAVRKVQDTFPSMITVGRTANNDLCISDVNVSRFHAFFRVHDDRVELIGSGGERDIGNDRIAEPAVIGAIARADHRHVRAFFAQSEPGIPERQLLIAVPYQNADACHRTHSLSPTCLTA